MSYSEAKIKKVLTIAGSDSGGGAGIQADLKTLAARGVFGMSAVTALTAQNTLGVQGVLSVPPAFVRQQIDSVMMDMGADVWKTGMLANTDIVRVVAECAQHYGVRSLVVDPVMVAKGGDALLQAEACSVLRDTLLPLATVITPNHDEAEVLTGQKIQTVADMKEAAKKLLTWGAKAVVVKGGHLPSSSDAIDIFTDGQVWAALQVPRIPTKNSHGTGCTFASALAAEMAKGLELLDAVQTAKAYLTQALQRADHLHIGAGHGPVDHAQNLVVPVDKRLVSVTLFGA